MVTDDLKSKIVDFSQDYLGIFKDDYKTTVGIAGYTLDVRMSESPNYNADVPDFYMEDGSYVNDHIILKPFVLQLDGEVGDIHYSKIDGSIIEALIPNKIKGTFDNIYPNYKSNQTLQKMNNISNNVEYSTVASVVNKTGNIYDIYKSKDDKGTVGFFAFMDRLFYSKMAVKVETASRIYENMVLISFVPARDNTTNQVIGYQASFKQLRYAKTTLNKIEKLKKNPNEELKGKTSNTKDNGLQNGVKVDKSLLKGGVNFWGEQK